LAWGLLLEACQAAPRQSGVTRAKSRNRNNKVNERQIKMQVTLNQVKASAPNDCQICYQPLRSGLSFFDCKTVLGPWAWMCQACFDEGQGCGLGTGVGQEYDSKTDVKIRG